MEYHFESNEEFALKLDREDPLAGFRSRFFTPENKIYVNGNSLGLMSKDSGQSLSRVLDEWKAKGIGGWLEGEIPWFYFAEKLGEMASGLVGAEPDEVVATGTTTFNIHSLVSTFYRPEGNRTKIIASGLDFPTDIYALKSQIRMKGLDVKEHLVLVPAKDGRFIDEEKIADLMSDDVALLLLPSVLYRSGQLLNIQYLADQAHRWGITAGFDCSHSVGAVPHRLDEWGVDFAVWCSYKYLNGGPGSPAFIYMNKKHFNREPAIAGWFGYVKEKQFDMRLDFEHAKRAGGWQVSSTGILGAAALEGALRVILEAGIDGIREKSLKMTSYIIHLVDTLLGCEPYNFTIGTPREGAKRGGHIAVERAQDAVRIKEAMTSRGVVCDFRPPDIIRIAPVALYNGYHEIWLIVTLLKDIIDGKEYEAFSLQRKVIP